MADPNSSRQPSPSSSAANENNIEKPGDDVLEPSEQQLETLPAQPKIDINALKNDILTDGMQVSAACGLTIAIVMYNLLYYVY